jgi:probable HAF family extracellular repeat protein
MVCDRKLRVVLWLLPLLLGLNVIAAGQVPAVIYTYTTIDVPAADPSSTTPMAINNLGQIVGTYTANGQEYGFLYDFGTFSNLGANIYPTAINDSGVIAGSNGSDEGFPSITLPNCSGCVVNDVAGINDLGETVGTYYAPSGGTAQNFALLSDGLQSVCPSTNPIIYAIGNSSLIVGETNTGAGAFVQDGVDGSCTTYAFPGLALPTDTTFYGINLWGLAVGGAGGNGGAWSPPPGPFVAEWSELGVTWAEIQLYSPPAAPFSAFFANGVNDFGQIVGTYGVGFGQGTQHGYVTSSGLVFMLSTPLSATTVTPGGSVTATITLSSINNFTGSMMLSCSVSPSSQNAPTCSFNPNPLTPPAGGSASSTLTISTASAGAALQSPSGNGDNARHVPPLLLSILVLAGVCVSVQGRRKPLPCLAFACLVFICLPCLSCGSKSSGNSGNGGGVTGGGTAPGTYVITVSASGQTAQTTSLTLTVQ